MNTIDAAPVRIHGRATRVLDKRVLGQRVGSSWLWPLATIAVSAIEVTVTPLWSSLTSDAVVSRGEVRRVRLTSDYRRASGQSVAFEFADGSFWRYQLGPTTRVLKALEALGWPVDRDSVVAAKDSFDRARSPDGLRTD